jgi:hypothetical protein
MTLLAPDNRRLQHRASTLRLDPPALALLRALASGRAAQHPVFGGPVGQAARRLLIDQGALHPDGTPTPSSRALLGPVRCATVRVHARVSEPVERDRTIWITDQGATVATTHADGTLALRLEDPSDIGAGLVSWLGIRPLPELEGRAAWSAEPADPQVPNAHTAWLVERHGPHPAATRWVGAVDAGHDGWRIARGSHVDRDAHACFEPVGVAAVYVALSHLVS